MEDGTIHKMVAPHTVLPEGMVEFIKVRQQHTLVQGNAGFVVGLHLAGGEVYTISSYKVWCRLFANREVLRGEGGFM